MWTIIHFQICFTGLVWCKIFLKSLDRAQYKMLSPPSLNVGDNSLLLFKYQKEVRVVMFQVFIDLAYSPSLMPIQGKYIHVHS